jgi:pilus assembly protein CpaF
MSFELILPFFPQPLQDLILDTTVADLCINGTAGVFVERNGVMSAAAGISIGEEQLSAAIQQIARVLGKDITEQDPILDTRLPNGSRVAALYKPCSPAGVTVTIRKFNRWFTTDELVAMGSLPLWFAIPLLPRSSIAGTSSFPAAPVPANPPCSTLSSLIFRPPSA